MAHYIGVKKGQWYLCSSDMVIIGYRVTILILGYKCNGVKVNFVTSYYETSLKIIEKKFNCENTKNFLDANGYIVVVIRT